MEHRPVGVTGVTLPTVIFGTSALGNLYSAPDYESKKAIIEECLLNVPKPVVFDSAGKYGAGLALEMVGEILHDLGPAPEDIVISNKLGWIRSPLLTPEPTFEKGVWVDLKNDAKQIISHEGILKCWEQGNQLLGGGYQPQMLSVHDPDEYLNSSGDDADFKKRFGEIIEAYKALSYLKKQGNAKAIGVGAKNWKTIQLITNEVDLDWVMIANSMTIYRHPKELLAFMDELKSKDITIINSAVFHAGFLTGGDFFDYVPLRADSAEDRSKFEWREKFFSICKKYNTKPADACIKFALSPPGVISISLNTSNPGRIKRNVDSFDSVIPEGFWNEMRKNGLIDREYPYLF